MKLKPILSALAVAVAAIAQPALAGFQFTQNDKGEVSHYNGIPLPPIQTVEEAKAQAQKKVAAAKKAQEAEQAAAASASNLQSEIGNQQLFFTGKPYLEETGQYLFLFRHYDPELARWTVLPQTEWPKRVNGLSYGHNPKGTRSMNKTTRRHQSLEDKVRILRLQLLEGKPISEICEAEGIHPTLFYQWQSRAKARQPA